ncbi:hypothetical protein ACHAXM_005901 [Skeletonema potamos]
MSAPTLSDIDAAMEMQTIPVIGYRDTPQEVEDEEDTFSDDNADGDDELDMIAVSSPPQLTQNESTFLKRHSYLLACIIVGLACIILLAEFLRGNDSSSPNARIKVSPGDTSSTSSVSTKGENLIIEFTIANLRTNSQNCTHVGKMLQCIPQHNNATNKFRIQLHESWSPIGVQRFQELTQAGFWDDARIFRVVPGFVSQFGISSYPSVQKHWESLGNLKDDKVIGTNKRGTVTFATAGPNTRTTQIFINIADNTFLDKQGFSPIGEVLPAGNGFGGMEVVDEFFSKYGEGPDQDMIKKRGEDYLEEKYPLLSYFVTAVFV